MPERTLEQWEPLFKDRLLSDLAHEADPAHDLAHIGRVVATARRLAAEEKADLWVVLPAAWMHDLINVPKNDPRRGQASRLSAEGAEAYLKEIGYPARHLAAIRHAIEAHSFSANIRAETLEAKIVQDADRLDGLGAIGIARCFSVGGALQRKFYHPDFFAPDYSEYNDQLYTLDHFFVKLFKVAETLQTQAGQIEGRKRADFMRAFIAQLAGEVHRVG